MHPYATDSDERRMVTVYLVILSILIGGACSAITEALSWWGEWFWNFSPVVWFLLLYWLTDRWLWRMPLLHLPFLFQLPDLNGTWRGELRSSYTEFQEAKPCTMTISQRWSRLHVAFCLDRQTSGSHSVAASLLLDYQGNVTLRYEYINLPAEEFRGILDIHGGSTQLILKHENFQRTLDGRYYTDRVQQTRGSIIVSKF